MLIKDAIRIPGRSYSPLDLRDIKLPDQLDLTIKDLRDTERLIREQYSRVLPKDTAYINGEFNVSPGNLFERAFIAPGTLFSHRLDGNEVPDFHQEVVGVRGCGNTFWLSVHNPIFFNPDGVERQYPIHALDYTSTFHSGDVQIPILRSELSQAETKEDVARHYINALVLNALSKRHNLAPTVFRPIWATTMEQLPLMESPGNIKIVSPTKYCDGQYKHPNDLFGYRLPSIDEVEGLAQLVYVAESAHLRNPPRTFKCGCSRTYTAGRLSNLGSVEKKWGEIERFTIKLASMVNLVHSYNGTFTPSIPNELLVDESHVRLWHKCVTREFDFGDFSLGGDICDVRGLNFPKDDRQRAIAQRRDLDRMARNVLRFAEMLDDPVGEGDPSAVAGSYKFGEDGLYARNNYGGRALKLVREICRDDSEIVNISLNPTDYPK